MTEKCENCNHLIEKDSYGDWKHRLDFSILKLIGDSRPSECRVGKGMVRCGCKKSEPKFLQEKVK